MQEAKFRYKWWALTGISLLAFTAFLDFTIVNTALPFIQKNFNANVLELQWVTNIFSMILTMTMIAGGKIADKWGRKKIFYISSLIFALGAVGAGVSANIETLIFFRALQGLGAAVLFVSSAALVSGSFPSHEQSRAIGIYSAITGSGLMLGPFVGGILIAALDWRWVFWINLPLIFLGMILCLISLKDLKEEKQNIPIDWLGLLFLIIGLGSLIFGIIQGAERGWNSSTSWPLIMLGLFCTLSLFVMEKKSKSPLLNFTILKDKLILLAIFSCSLAGIVSFVFMFFDPLYLRTVRELAPLQIGLWIAIIPAAQVIISFLFGSLVKKMGIANLLLFSCIAALLAVLSHRAINLSTPLAFLVLPFSLLGINWGISNAGTIKAVAERIAPNKMGEVIGTIFTTWNFVGSVFLALGSVIFHAKQTGSSTSFLEGFHAVIEYESIFMLIIVLAAIRLKAKP
jgi:EmrB/QacA subfamily drug resistance transporter